MLSEVTILTTEYQPRIVITLSKPITSKVVLKSKNWKELGKYEYYDYFAKFLLFAIQVLNISCRYSYPWYKGVQEQKNKMFSIYFV